ncbi:MAG: S9 family peptidase [Gammaproteobacteria bacterium]|nr:S9 family peptidase [Gammaproteobacteria bacterium]
MFDTNTNKPIAALNLTSIKPQLSYFIDENRLILVTSKNTRIGGYRGRHDISTAVSFNVQTKDVYRLLEPGNGIYKGQTRLGSIVGLSSNGKFAYMPAYTSEATYSLMKAFIDKRRTPRVFKKGTSDTIDFFVENKDNLLARERYDNEDDLHRIESYIDDEWVTIFSENTPYKTRAFVGLTPDYKSLVMLAQNDAGRWAYYTMALSDGKISEALFNKSEKDVENVLTDVSRVVYGVQYSGFKPTYEFFDDNLTKMFDEMRQQSPHDSLHLIDHTPDWKKVVVKIEGSTSSGDYFIYDGKEFQYLTSARQKISPENVHQITEFRYETRDGVTIPTLITLPKVEKVNNLPAMILPHGGPESYDQIEFNWLAQYFASKGFIVVQPQFRGSTGFGAEHTLSGRGEWGRKMQNDLTDAVTVLKNKGYINPEQVCIAGISYGGYAALAGAVFTPDLYKCVISINGVSDVDAMMTTERRNYGSDHWVVSYWEDVIAKGSFNEDHLAQISPINHAKKIQAPVLLIHGTYDKVVPIDQSEEMEEALEDEDKDVTFVELPRGDHHLSTYKNRIAAMHAIDKFVDKDFN